MHALQEERGGRFCGPGSLLVNLRGQALNSSKQAAVTMPTKLRQTIPKAMPGFSRIMAATAIMAVRHKTPALLATVAVRAARKPIFKALALTVQAAELLEGTVIKPNKPKAVNNVSLPNP